MRALRSVFIVGLLLVFIGILLGDNAIWIAATQGGTWRWIGAAVAALLLMLYVLFFAVVKAPNGNAPGKPVARAATKDEVHVAFAEIRKAYDPKTIDFFVNALIDFKQHVVRINEDVIIEDGPSLRIKARQQYDVSGAESTDPGKSSLLVPLLRPEKGVLLDAFSVANAAGDEVPTLPYTRVRGLLAFSLMALFTMAEQELARSIIDEAHKASQQTLGQLILAICGPGPIHRQPAGRRRNIERTLALIDDLPFTPPWKERIKLFCTQYVDCYVVVAEVPWPTENQLILNYSYRTRYSAITDNKNRWRVRFGLTPAIIDIPLNAYAFHVPTYHLQVASDPGQYVYDHYIARLHSNEPIKQKDLQTNGVTPYVRVYYNEGRPNAHLYVRRQGDVPTSTAYRLKTRIQFREIPPGVLGGSLVVAAACAALITFFALTHIGLGLELAEQASEAERAKDQLSATLNSDIPALLLALPAFTAALMGSWSDFSRVRRTSLVAYFGLLGTMVLSVSSALHLVYDANHKLATEIELVAIWGGKITTEKIWLVLMLLAWTMTLTLLQQLISELRHYTSTSRRQS